MFPNRQFQPASEEMVHTVSIGEHPHPSGKTQIIDDAACLAMVMNFEKQAAQPNFPGLPVDFDHGSMDPKMPSQAAGWVRGLETRDDGLWARVAFTGLGDRMVSDGTYRNVSPVFGRVQSFASNRVRPVELISIGLCNDPNIKGMVPLSNRQHSNFMNTRANRPQLLANRNIPQALKNTAHALYNRATGEATGKSVIRLQDFIGAVRRASGESFDEAYTRTQPLMNRFNNRDGAADTDALWREVLTKEQEAFDKSYERLAHHQAARLDRGYRAYAKPGQIKTDFMGALVNAMDKNGAPFEEAWNLLKETEPCFFARHVWAMTDPIAGRW